MSEATESFEITPRPMTPENLREIAEWMDVHDTIARAYIDLALTVGLGQHSELMAAVETLSGTEVQDDLRRWAAQIEDAQPKFGVIEDGFGSEWARCKADCGLQVVRPGKVQCECDWDDQ